MIKETNRKTPAWRSLAVAGFLLTALPAPPVGAQPTEEPAERIPLTEEMATRLDSQISAIERQLAEMTQIENRLAATDGTLADVLQRRLDDERIEVVDEGVRLGTAVAAQAQAGYIVDTYATAALELLRTNLAIAELAWTSSSERTQFPQSDLSAAEQAARNLAFYETQRTINEVIGLMGDSFELLTELGMPQAAAEAAYADRVRERAINASVYLEMAQDAAAAARASQNAVPDDTEISARVAVAAALVAQTANLFDRVVSELERIEEDTAGYRQQIITATGEITPDAFNFSVMGELASRWGRTVLDTIGEQGPTFLFRSIVFLLIVFVFYKLSRIARTVVESGVNRSEAALSQLLKRMIVVLVSNLVLAIGVLIALSQLGISLGPLLAGLGIAGFIVGFALQDSLANFASGLMILFYRPYDVGDIVEVGGVTGKVDQMSLVNTTVNTFDNQRIIVPNSMIWGSTIKNVTAETIRRVDMVFGISYSDDIPKTEGLLKEIVASHELVLDDPEPVVRLHELADSSVNFVVRPWTQTSNYWEVYWDITRAVKLRFDEAGISIPFPQRDVHLIAAQAVPSEAASSTRERTQPGTA